MLPTYQNFLNLLLLLLSAEAWPKATGEVNIRDVHQLLLDPEIHILLGQDVDLRRCSARVLFDRAQHQILIILHPSIVGKHRVSKVAVSLDFVDGEEVSHGKQIK